MIISNDQQMINLGEKFASLLMPGDTIFLNGQLGSGKTTLTKGIAKGLGINKIVSSPSFQIIKLYDQKLCHVDGYRIDQEDLGIEDYQKSGYIVCIEWPGAISDYLEDPTYTVTIDYFGKERKVKIMNKNQEVTFNQINIEENFRLLYTEGIEQGNYQEAIEKYANDPYTQHSTGVETGKEGFKKFFKEFISRSKSRKFVLEPIFSEGDLVFAMAHQNINDGESQWITMDIIQADQSGKFIEHWDIIQAYTSKVQKQGNFKVFDLDKTQTNKQFIIDNIFNLNQLINSTNNNSVNKGIEINSIYRIVAKGNFVACLVKSQFLGKDSASMHLFSMRDNQIIGYWDAIELIPTPEVARNSGKF